MIKALFMIVVLLLHPALRAAEGLSASAAGDGLSDEDVYYAPIDDGAAEPASATAQAPAQAASQGSVLSHARLFAYDIRNGQPLEGAELFVDGAYQGRSPLRLSDLLVSKPLLPVSARLDGYDEGQRPGVAIPADGDVGVALASQSAASWYTTPAWVVGLGLLAVSAAVYDSNNSAPGLAAAGGGLAVISLSQLAARLLHLPALRRRAQAANGQSSPMPPLDRRP